MKMIGKRKGWMIAGISTAMLLAYGGMAYAGQGFPETGNLVWDQASYGARLSAVRNYGWENDAQGNWYYRSMPDNEIKTGWFYDQAGGYWYYLNPADGKMVTGWQTIDGKQYFFQPVQAGTDYPFASEQERNRYTMNSRFPYGAMYADTMTLDGIIVDGSGARADGAAAASEAVPPVFSDKSFVGFYCDYYQYGGYNEETYEPYWVKTNAQQYREARDKYDRYQGIDKYDRYQGFAGEIYAVVDSIDGGYIKGFYDDGSTGASLEMRGEFNLAIDGTGTARDYNTEGSGPDGYEVETVITLQKEGSEKVIHIQKIIHKYDNFDAVANDWLKMELGNINGSGVYLDSYLIKYD